MSDVAKIKEKKAQFLANINSNPRISSEKKKQLSDDIIRIEQESEGNFQLFEDNIICDISHEDMQIIHVSSSQQQKIESLPKLNQEELRYYHFQTQKDMFEKCLSHQQSDHEFPILKQKFQQMREQSRLPADLTLEQLNKVQDKQWYFNYYFNIYINNLSVLKDPSRKDRLEKFIQKLKNRITNEDPLLFHYYHMELNDFDRKVLQCEDKTCKKDLDNLTDYFRRFYQPIALDLEQLQSPRDFVGLEGLYFALRERGKLEKHIDYLHKRQHIFNVMNQQLQQDIVNYLKQNYSQGSEINARYNDIQIVIREKLRIAKFKEHLLFNELTQRELKTTDPLLAERFQNNPKLQNAFNLFEKNFVDLKQATLVACQAHKQISKQSWTLVEQELSAPLYAASLYTQKNVQSAPDYETSNVRRVEQQSNQNSIIKQSPGKGVISQQDSRPSSLQSTPIPAQQINPATVYSGPQQSNQYTRPPSQTINLPPSNSQPPQAPGIGIPRQFQNENNIHQQTKQVNNQMYQQPPLDLQQKEQQLPRSGSIAGGVSAKAILPKEPNPIPEERSMVNPTKIQQQQPSTTQQIQLGQQPVSLIGQKGGIKQKRILNDESLSKKLRYFCSEQNVDLPDEQINGIISLIHDSFKIYMKNLLERLLQSGIVENVDNEFRLFCSDRLDPHLMPFRSQNIDKYLLNRQDLSGVRDMSFLKYYIVQSENKNIRRNTLDRLDDDLEAACIDAIEKSTLFDKSVMKYDLDRTQRKGDSAAAEIKQNILKQIPTKPKQPKKDTKNESMSNTISLATTNCSRLKITLKNLQLFLESDPIYRKSFILLKTYLN